MIGSAFAFAFVLAVAPPYHPAVLVCAVPDLTAVVFSAVSADDL